MTIQELEDLIKAAPNKSLQVVAKSVDGDSYEVVSALLEDTQLVIQEGDEVIVNNEDEDKE